MAPLSWDVYFDKTLGCWMGKNAGGTLGEPMEGRREILDLDWYPEVREGGIPNDDLEVQLVWLHALETRGQDLSAAELAAEWLDHYLPNWDEYGFGKTNVRKGLLPPLSGSYNNAFSTSMGCPIRSEIWACIAPGLPLLAARRARTDAMVDHTDESIYAEMLFAVLESCAYVESDRDRLMALGLAAIPDTCRTAVAVRTMMSTWRETHDWRAARQAILDAVGDYANFTDAPQNIGFTLLGWYSAPDDFGRAICDAVNCGFDTDCTGATLGSIYGIAWGAKRLPKRWIEPLGDTVAILEARTRLRHPPKTLLELTERTAAVAVASLARQGYVFGPGRVIEVELPSPEEVRRSIRDAGLWNTARDTVEHRFHHGRARVRYPSGPVLGKGENRVLEVTVSNDTERRLEGPIAAVSASPGLRVGPCVPDTIDLAPGESVEVRLDVALAADAPAECHSDLALVVRAEGMAPWSCTVSFVRPMIWHMEKREPECFEALSAEEPTVAGEPVAVTTNLIPLPTAGTWLGRTRVLNPSAHEREVRICAPSTLPVRLWLNGVRVVDNPGSERIRPSFHSNAPHHYGAAKLVPGWNTLTGIWRQRAEPGCSHVFLTEPDGRGWGDLAFEA